MITLEFKVHAHLQQLKLRLMKADDFDLEERLATTGSNEALTGSGSLLSTSELDGWNGRQRTPWASIDNTSPGLSTTNLRPSGTSPMRRQSSGQHSSQPFHDSSSNTSPFFSITPAPSNQGALTTAQQHRDPRNGSFATGRAAEVNGIQKYSRHNSNDDDRYATSSLAFGSHDSGIPIHPHRQSSQISTSSFTSGAVSRNGSLPPSRNDVDPLMQLSEELQNSTYTHPNGSSSSVHNPHFQLSAQAHTFSRHPTTQTPKSGDLSSSTNINNVAGDFAKMNIAKENQHMQSMYGLQMGATSSGQVQSMYEFPQQQDAGNVNAAWDADESGYQDLADRYAPSNLLGLQSQGPYRTSALNPSYPHSPASSDGRRSSQSPYYSADAIPPYTIQSRPPLHGSLTGNIPQGQAQLLDRKLRGVQQERQGYIPAHHSSLHFRAPFPNPYDFHPQHALRMNPINPYYPVPPVANMLPPVIPRGPAKDQDSSHSTRSACLEEFRSNSKTNKRYELKVSI